MTEFIQLHLLTAYPPSNLNRDDLGRPKTAIVGGTTRLRISSQSLKRAWRKSELFQEALANHIGIRTKIIGKEIFNTLKEKGISENNSKEWSKKIAEVFGKLKKQDTNNPLNELEIEQLVHISPEEYDSVSTLVDKLIERKSAPTAEEIDLLRAKNKAVDIASFGRMLASKPAFNIEAAIQVSHAFTVQKVAVEDDYFTAVDDLNSDEDSGSAHIGETEFSSGLFYLYICINRDLLLENLNQDEELVKKTLKAITETAAKISPTGKQNSYASRARASYILIEKGDEQPRSLSVAFLKAINGEDILDLAIKQLEKTRKNIDDCYGKCAKSEYIMNVFEGKGKFSDLLNFIAANQKQNITDIGN